MNIDCSHVWGAADTSAPTGEPPSQSLFSSSPISSSCLASFHLLCVLCALCAAVALRRRPRRQLHPRTHTHRHSQSGARHACAQYVEGGDRPAVTAHRSLTTTRRWLHTGSGRQQFKTKPKDGWCEGKKSSDRCVFVWWTRSQGSAVLRDHTPLCPHHTHGECGPSGPCACVRTPPAHKKQTPPPNPKEEFKRKPSARRWQPPAWMCQWTHYGRAAVGLRSHLSPPPIGLSLFFPSSTLVSRAVFLAFLHK